MNLIKKLDKLIDSNVIKLPEDRCWYCNHPIFNVDSCFGKMGMCVNCYQAYELGRKSVLDKYPEQFQINCRKCGNILVARRITDIFETNKMALCCNNPDYTII